MVLKGKIPALQASITVEAPDEHRKEIEKRIAVLYGPPTRWESFCEGGVCGIRVRGYKPGARVSPCGCSGS